VRTRLLSRLLPSPAAGGRHRLAAIAIAVALPAGYGALSANPALLASTADGGLPSYGGSEPTSLGGSGECGGFCYVEPYVPPEPEVSGLSQPVIEQAQRGARNRLAQPACLALITGGRPRKGKTATQALDDAFPFNRRSSSGPRVGDIAAAQKDGAPLPSGVKDGIFYYTPFNAPGPIGGLVDLTTVRIVGPLSVEDVQVLVVLHEVGHLTEAHSHPDGDPGKPFNTRILFACFPELVQVVTAPTPPRRAPSDLHYNEP
jgi:hypothetical protein